mgnify:CR=1 FL=1
MREHNLKINCMSCTYPEERKKLPKKDVKTCKECGVQVVRFGKCSECGNCVMCNRFVSKRKIAVMRVADQY